MGRAPLRREDLQVLRRSIGAAGQLPAGQARLLIDELDRLLAERAAIAELLDSLPGPWAELRRVMNALHTFREPERAKSPARP